jgi:hypothetical protein
MRRCRPQAKWDTTSGMIDAMGLLFCRDFFDSSALVEACFWKTWLFANNWQH